MHQEDPRIKIYTELINDSQCQTYPNLIDLQTKLKKCAACKPVKQAESNIPTPFQLAFCLIEQKIVRPEKCWRCGECRIGHSCAQVLCFECEGVGHVRKDCPWKRTSASSYDANNCLICKRFGHTATNCIDRGYCNKQDAKKITCLACRERGHVNCCELWRAKDPPDYSRKEFERRSTAFGDKNSRALYQNSTLE